MGSSRVYTGWCALLLLAVTVPLAPPALAATAPPNVVLVILDDVGVELFGAYNRGGAEVQGATPPEHTVTPHIDALAEAGLLFRDVWSAPLCKPTRAALATGLYGFHNGSITNDEYAVDGVTMLPERLASAPVPYVERRAIGKWHLSSWAPYVDGARAPTALGFTAYAGVASVEAYTGYPWAVDPPPVPAELAYPPEYRTEKDFDEALAFVAAAPPEPWFLWLALKAAHRPWVEAETPTDPTSRCNVHTHEPSRVRCRQLEIVDERLGELLAALGANDPGLAHTTVFLLGDNGSPEPGGARPDRIPGQVNRDGKGSLYEGGVNVPLIVAGAGVAANDPATVEETNALVHVVDVMATVLELGGAALPVGAVDGIGFARVLRGEAPRRSCLYVDGVDISVPSAPLLPASHDVAVRNRTHKLIRRGETWGDHAFELYDLANDPGETTPLPPSGPAFDALYAVLERVDTNPFGSPCSPSRQRYECGLGPELLPALLALAALRTRRRR